MKRQHTLTPTSPDSEGSEEPLAPEKEDRASTGLRGKDYVRLHESVCLANLHGQVLNVHMSIAWSTVGVVGDKEVGNANGKFLELLRHWLSVREIAHAWVWVLERSAKIGLHCHILVHVPMKFQHGLKSWAEDAFESVTGKAAVTEGDGKSVFVRKTHNWDCHQQGIWFSYVLKGLRKDETVRDGRDRRARHYVAYHVKIGVRDQGIIRTKRCGNARAIGPRACRDAARRYPVFAAELAFVEPIGERFLRLGEAIETLESLDL